MNIIGHLGLVFSLLPRDAMPQRGICYRRVPVRPSVRTSVHDKTVFYQNDREIMPYADSRRGKFSAAAAIGAPIADFGGGDGGASKNRARPARRRTLP